MFSDDTSDYYPIDDDEDDIKCIANLDCLFAQCKNIHDTNSKKSPAWEKLQVRNT